MRAKVIDSFDVKGRVAVEYGSTGVVVIFAAAEGSESPFAGERVLIVKPDGWVRSAVIGEVKLADKAPGFFLRGLEKSDVPVGTRLKWGRDIPATFLDNLVLASAV